MRRRRQRECEDCGDVMTGKPGMVRRRRCRTCGQLVCGWCYHHVHNDRHGWATLDVVGR